MSFIPPELFEWLSAVVKRLDVQIDAQRSLIQEIKLLRIELRQEREKLEGKRT